MPTVKEILNAASNHLSATTPTPRLDAELLLTHILHCSRAYLHAHSDVLLSPEQEQAYTALVNRRINKEPIAYILGKQDFWSLTLTVTPATLIPRPDTECLVEAVLSLFPTSTSHIKLADLGTGSGAIALALAHERPRWQIYAVDRSIDALEIARKNAQQLRLTHIEFLHSNWCTALPCNDFDVIVSNPPYIADAEWLRYGEGLRYEPESALRAGVDGLQDIRIITSQAKHYLRPDGYLFVEHGFLQGEQVRLIFTQAGFLDVQTKKDVTGKERITVGRI